MKYWLFVCYTGDEGYQLEGKYDNLEEVEWKIVGSFIENYFVIYGREVHLKGEQTE